jgi:hypothetical protein
MIEDKLNRRKADFIFDRVMAIAHRVEAAQINIAKEKGGKASYYHALKDIYLAIKEDSHRCEGAATIIPAEIIQEIQKYLKSPDYTPPLPSKRGYPLALYQHGIALFLYYCFVADAAPTQEILQVDLSMARLTLELSLWANTLDNVTPEEQRLHSSKKTTKTKRKRKKQTAIEEYYKLEGRALLSKNAICRKIEERLTASDGKKLVSYKTIGRYLEEEGLF